MHPAAPYPDRKKLNVLLRTVLSVFFGMFCLPVVAAADPIVVTSWPENSPRVSDPIPTIRTLGKRTGTAFADTFGQVMLYQCMLATTGMVYIRVPTLGILPELGGDWDDPSLERWRENFSGAPVHPDEDKWVVNYVGHPVNGAHMYVFARHNGFGFLASFAISTLGSVMWEYGVEGFFEPPSRSDLIVTSTLGSFLGEVYYQMFRKIRKSSISRKWYGKVLMWTLNPNYFLFE